MTQEDEYVLLSNLKMNLINAAETINLKLTEPDFGWKREKDSNKKKFYLLHRDNNLFEKPYKDVKLGKDVEAIRSSAAMIFNLLGQTDITINGKHYGKPNYETKLGAIFDKLGNKHNANLDATLYSEDEFLAIEAKLLEWSNSPKKLPSAYLNSNMYFYKEHSTCFIDFFKWLINIKFKKYDAFQMAIHILALYNECLSNKKLPKKISLWNVVWEHKCDDYDKEKAESNTFIEYANQTFKPLFKKIGHNFSVEYKTFQNVRDSIDYTNNPKRIEYLKRYDI